MNWSSLVSFCSLFWLHVPVCVVCQKWRTGVKCWENSFHALFCVFSYMFSDKTSKNSCISQTKGNSTSLRHLKRNNSAVFLCSRWTEANHKAEGWEKFIWPIWHSITERPHLNLWITPFLHLSCDYSGSIRSWQKLAWEGGPHWRRKGTLPSCSQQYDQLLVVECSSRRVNYAQVRVSGNPRDSREARVIHHPAADMLSFCNIYKRSKNLVLVQKTSIHSKVFWNLICTREAKMGK